MNRGVPHPAVAGIAVAILVIDAGTWAMIVLADAVYIPLGRDYETYIGAAHSFLEGQGFYHAYQLAGPYAIGCACPDAILYPPTLLWLLLPFTVLPAILWWAPVLIVGWIVWTCGSRPRQLLALSLALWPQTAGMVGAGNPGMWIVAMLALATRYPVFAPWVLLKPTLAPFALYRGNRRSWWLGLAAFAIGSAAFLPLWFDWLTAIRNSNGDPLYSLTNVIPMLIPLVAQQRSHDPDDRRHRVEQLAVPRVLA